LVHSLLYSIGWILLLTVGCSKGGPGATAWLTDSGAPSELAEGGTPSDAAVACAGPGREHVPANHRAAEGPECPRDRAPGGLPAECAADSGVTPAGNCQQDSDCNAGTNGRCLQVRGCYMACSYDECFRDADCSDNVPCQCRDSSSSTGANTCLVNSNCRVDDDCGPGGYCSPSQLAGCIRMCTVTCDLGTHCYAGTTEVPCSCNQNCGAGYFCHTASDTCVSDCECSGKDSACTHQPDAGWACIPCGVVW
jgi:hypothetical protein